MALHVKWPRVWKTNHGRLVVQGATAPGALLVIAGERVTLEPDGRFTHVVALREGEQRLRAHARAVGGLEASGGPGRDPRHAGAGRAVRHREASGSSGRRALRTLGGRNAAGWVAVEPGVHPVTGRSGVPRCGA